MMTPQQLKNSILQRAIEGKLVEQRAEEGTAKELLKDIKLEKEKLVKEGKIKKSKPLPPITEDEIPFEIPDSWEWVRFDEFGVYKKGPFGSALTKSIFVPKSDDTIKVYEQKNAIQKDTSLGDYYITRQYFEEHMKGFELEAGDIIVSCAGTIGETFIIPRDCEKGIINQALMRMKLMPSVYVPFFLLYFDFILKETARKSSKGSALKNIPPFAELKNYLVPLPPLSEQHRIVAKIEELLPLVDQYDKAYSQLTALNEKFPQDMKKSILQYAIEGKLVEQRPEEGTAKELLKEIKLEKEKLVKEGKIKKSKALPPITEDEIPFDIPESWEWVLLGEIAEIKSSKRVFESDYVTDGIPFYRSKEIGDLSRNEPIKTELYITRLKYNEFEEKYGIPKENDILVTSVGSIGNVWISDGREFYYKDGNVAQICANSYYVPKYVTYFMQSNEFALQSQKTVSGTAYNALTLIKLKNIAIPLPPLSEQHRIVAKIEELLPLCDKLVKTK